MPRAPMMRASKFTRRAGTLASNRPRAAAASSRPSKMAEGAGSVWAGTGPSHGSARPNRSKSVLRLTYTSSEETRPCRWAKSSRHSTSNAVLFMLHVLLSHQPHRRPYFPFIIRFGKPWPQDSNNAKLLHINYILRCALALVLSFSSGHCSSCMLALKKRATA